MNYIIKLAKMKDIDDIIKLYSERMQWFRENNIKQWNKYLNNHSISEFEDAINNKNYYIIKNNDEIIAGFEMSTKRVEYRRFG